MSAQFCERVGGNIKKFRKEKGMTMKELAEKVGLTEATVQKYEAGNIKKIDVVLLKNFADVLEVPPERITEWEKEAYADYREKRQGQQEAKVIKKYNQLTLGHKKAVLNLMDSLIACQEKYNSSK